MFLLRSAFWLTVAFILIAPKDVDLGQRAQDMSAKAIAAGQQIVVDVEGTSARVQIVGGTSMVLPRSSDGYYTNGRYGFRGGGASGQWEVGRAAPADCTGS